MDYADKSQYRRSRFLRRLWAALQRRVDDRIRRECDSLSAGIRFSVNDGCTYINPAARVKEK